MSHDDEINALRAELAAMEARLDELAPETTRGPVTRRGLLIGLAGAGAATAATVAGLATAEPAGAATGGNAILGQTNAADATTRIDHTGTGDVSGLQVSTTGKAAILASTTSPPDSNPHIGDRAAIVGRSGDDDAAAWLVAATGFSLYASNESAGRPTVTGINFGTGPALGGASYGHGAQLYLAVEDGAEAGPPSGYAEPGYIRVDADADIWVCTEGGQNGPWNWTKLLRADTTSGRVIPVAPVRVLDSRATGGRPAGAPAVPGQTKGPLKGGQAITLDLAGTGPIPADATGVIGNLTVTATSYSGYLIATPSGSVGTTSALNWTAGATVGNAFTSKLGPHGLTLKANGSATQHYELIVDITAFIT